MIQLYTVHTVPWPIGAIHIAIAYSYKFRYVECWILIRHDKIDDVVIVFFSWRSLCLFPFFFLFSSVFIYPLDFSRLLVFTHTHSYSGGQRIELSMIFVFFDEERQTKCTIRYLKRKKKKEKMNEKSERKKREKNSKRIKNICAFFDFRLNTLQSEFFSFFLLLIAVSLAKTTAMSWLL